MPIRENSICIIYRIFSRISWFTLMNPDVIKGLDSDGQASHHLVCPLCKCHNFIATSDIKYCLPIPRMESFSYVSSAGPRMPQCSRTS